MSNSYKRAAVVLLVSSALLAVEHGVCVAGAPAGTTVHAVTGLYMSRAVADADVRNTTMTAADFAALRGLLLEQDAQHAKARRSKWAAGTTPGSNGALAAEPERRRRNWWTGGGGYTGVLPTIWNSLSYNVVDWRFDSFTRGLAVTNVFNLLNNERMYKPRLTAQNVGVPSQQVDIEGVSCGLAENVVVPRTDEDFGDVSNLLAFATDSVSQQLSFPETADACGEWDPNEDPKEVLKFQLLGAWPAKRVLTPWEGDVSTDRVLEQVVFNGFAQHRLQRVRPADPHGKTDGAYYAVYLDFAEALEVRPGFAKLGATAYFTQQGKIAKIVRLGKTYRPGGFQGTTRACNRDHCRWWEWWCRERCYDAQIGWRHAKLAFRGTLNAVITAIDHLYGVHLTVANAIVTANVEELPPKHPVRRLMTPFGFRTEAINYQASFALVNERGMFHRATPLTTAGMRAMFAYARTEASGVTWATIPQRKAAKGIDPEMVLPLDEDGLEFYAKINEYVAGYLHQYYDYEHNLEGAAAAAPDACTADTDLAKWHNRVNSISPNNDLPAAVTCTNLEDILTTFIYYVSAGHNHVGTIAAELEDPCFMPWAWREGELCGMPRTGFTQSMIMALTSMEQPKIYEDYTHIFLDAEAKQRWRDFTAELLEFDARVDQRNAQRERAFLAFDIQRIETAVGI